VSATCVTGGVAAVAVCWGVLKTVGVGVLAVLMGGGSAINKGFERPVYVLCLHD
jgi:hypothetical protein